LTERLGARLQKRAIGDPMLPGTLMGPLVSPHAVETMLTALTHARAKVANCWSEVIDCRKKGQIS